MTTVIPFYEFCSGWVRLSVGIWLVEIAVQGSGCLVGLCEGDPFLYKNSGVEHTCLALWMRLWTTDNIAEMVRLEL